MHKSYPMKQVFFLLIFLLFFSSCKPKVEPTEGVQVTVSIEPFAYFVDYLAGGELEMSVLVPSGASPATWEPLPRQMEELSRSGLFVANGYLGYELAWGDHLREAVKNGEMLKLADYQDLIAGEKHGDHYHAVDPHFWISPPSALRMIDPLTEALERMMPEATDSIQSRAQRLKEGIQMLDEQLRQQFEELENKTFFIFHPALSYLARDYGLEQISLEREGKEPGMKHMQEMIDLARKKGIQTIFVQKEFNRNNAETVAREIDGRVQVIDPLSRDWPGAIQQIARALLQENQSQ